MLLIILYNHLKLIFINIQLSLINLKNIINIIEDMFLNLIYNNTLIVSEKKYFLFCQIFLVKLKNMLKEGLEPSTLGS